MMTPRPDRFTYPAGDAHRGELILKKNWMRAVCIGGVVGLVLLALLLTVMR